jgi:hypothetical protein
MTTAQRFEARLRAGADETTAHELVDTVHEDRVIAACPVNVEPTLVTER